MEENKAKNLDSFVRKSVKEIGLESPSDDFTSNLFSKLASLDQKSAVVSYTPLISKFSWGVLAVLVACLSAYAIFVNPDTKLAWLEKMNMGALPKIEFLEAIPNLSLSNTMLYSLLVVAIFAAIQLILFKQRLDKSYAGS